MKALAFVREDRYSTAGELAAEIEHFAERHFAPVNGRDLGSILAQVFTDDRERIRSVLEAQLSRQPAPDAWLPELSFMNDNAKSAVRHGSGRSPSETSDTQDTQDTPLATGTLSREPVVTSAPSNVSASSSRASLTKGLLYGVAALALGGLAVAALGYQNRHKAVASPVRAQEPVLALPTERGVTEAEIRIGMSAVFSGPSRELGQNMKLGVETSFRAANDAGGVNGRKLTLTALDDGYEASRVGATMKELIVDRSVFAIVGNVGTPTSVIAAPFAAQSKVIFFGAFTGAPVLRQDPPDRYVFNYRASYKEETAKSIKYLLEVRRLAPEEIVVFAQEDSYGDAGFEGVTKAMRAFGHGDIETLRVGYKRNSTVVAYNAKTLSSARGSGDARIHPVKAVVMVATYRAAAKFIQRMHSVARLRDTLFFNVSFVGSETLAEELHSVDPALCTNVYVTQVVPPFDSGATGVLRYREQLAKYEPQAQPGFVSLEGFIVGSIFVEALERAGRDLTTEKLVDTLEQIDGLDLGFGTPITYSLSEHQGSHKVWGTRLDETCNYQAVDLD
jgi:ABC-type branched-subunit amino acid transport system substrate-binding protein